jgi:hypothetical protein
MKRKVVALVLLVLMFSVMTVYADQVKVNIVYPINGAIYPMTDPASGVLKSAYFTASFSVTCGGGGHKVEWGFDNAPALGKAMFYDQTSIQFVHKLPGGSHLFWVKSDCGENRVKFRIGK